MIDPPCDIQTTIDHPLTVHGSGGEVRAFIDIQDTVLCIQIALETPPKPGDRVQIFNQMTKTHRVHDLAQMITERTGARIYYLPNPRNETDENDLHVKNDHCRALGLDPITLGDGLMEEVMEIARKQTGRFGRAKILCVSDLA